MKFKDNGTRVLFILFIFMSFIVLLLSIILVYKKINDNDKVDLVVPLTSNSLTMDLNVDISNIKVGKDKIYKIKVNNYKEGILNKKKIKYYFNINDNNNDIEIYKNKSDVNIYKDGKTDNQILLIDNKYSTYYTIVISVKNKKSKFINIKINGEEL